MYSKYTIELSEVKGHAQAKIYQGITCLGTVWSPGNRMDTKQGCQELFMLIGGTIYGAEEHIKKEQEEKRNSKVTQLFQTKSDSR